MWLGSDKNTSKDDESTQVELESPWNRWTRRWGVDS